MSEQARPEEEAVLISLTAGQVKKLGRWAGFAVPSFLALLGGGGWWAVDEVSDSIAEQRARAFAQIDSLWLERGVSVAHFDGRFDVVEGMVQACVEREP